MRAPSRLPVVGFLACLAGSSACGKGSTPDIEGVAPRAICIEQGPATVTVSGHGLSPMVRRGLTGRPDAVAPGVSLVRTRALGAETGEPTARSVALSSPSVRWAGQSSISFELGPGTAGPGVYDLEIRNPNGEVTRLADGLVIVPPPAASTLEPEVLVGEAPNSLTIRGDFFLASADARPTVVVHGAGPDPLPLATGGVADCTTLPGPDAFQLCRAVTLLLPPNTLPPGAFAVEVVNPDPASCTTGGFAASTQGRLPLTVVPRPKIATLGEGVSCIAEADHALTVTGEGFLVHGDGSPSLLLGNLALPATAAGCTDAALDPSFAPRARALSSCTELTVTVPKGAMPPGIVPAVVRNPETSPGTSDPLQYLVAGPPVVSALGSDVMCSESGDPVLLFGQGFLKVAAETPVVRLGAVELPAVAGGCAPVDGLSQPIEVCTELSVKLPEETFAGTYPVVVRNPAFAPCSSIEPITLANVAPPTVTKVDPPLFCGGVETEVSLTGTNFLVLGGVMPTVEIGGEEVTVVPKGCLPVVGSTSGAQTCTGLELLVPAGTVEFAAQELDVENPSPADCDVTAPVPIQVVPPPVITSARLSVRVGGAAVIEISGSGFVPGAAVSVDGLATSGGTVVSPTSAIAVVAPGASEVEGATVTIDNGDGCMASASVTVGSLPATPFGSTGASGGVLLSTRSALGAVTTPLTLTGADGAVEVALQGAAGSLVLPFAADPLRPGYLLAALPPGTAAGSYDVLVIGGDGSADHAGRLEVAGAALSVAEATVAEAGLAVAGDGGDGVPAAFLVRADAGEAAVAIPLPGVARRADGTIEVETAGASLAPGDYDLLLVGTGRESAAPEARRVSRALQVAPSGEAGPELAALAPRSPSRPALLALSLVAAESGGLAAGTWHYRVSALLGTGDETSASASAGVEVPGDAGAIAIALEWAPVDGAVGYRVYRTPASGAPAGAERPLAETPAGTTSFVDGGEPVETLQ